MKTRAHPHAVLWADVVLGEPQIAELPR